MKKEWHYSLYFLVVALVLTLGLYTLLPRQKTVSHEHKNEQHNPPEVFDIAVYEKKKIASLPHETQEQLQAVKTRLPSQKDTTQLFERLAYFWLSLDSSSLNPLLYAYYSQRYAKALGDGKKQITTGRLLSFMALRSRNPNIHNLLLDWSNDLLVRASKQFPNDDSLRVDIALLSLWYMNDGKRRLSPMEGVRTLKQIIEQNPQQAYALYVLGTASLISGQYAKAVTYFERFCKLKPQHLDGMIALGNAYQQSGNSQKARQWFSKARNTTKKPALQKQLNKKIKNL